MIGARLPAVPDYGDVIDRNNIEALLVPSDLAIVDGDLAVTRRGDLMLNSEEYSAFFSLVNWWRFNYPVLSVLFHSVFPPAEDEVNSRSLIEGGLLGGENQGSHANWSATVENFHRMNDTAGAQKVAKGLYAGTIVVALSNALQVFRHDIRAGKAAWDQSRPQFDGVSLGQVVVAAANNVRHADEWQITRPPTPQQLQSIIVLAAALREKLDPPDGARHKLHREVSPEILSLLSDGNFQKLEERIFAFAKSMYSTLY